MGFRIKIEGGPETIELSKTNVISVEYLMETPDDSNAKSTDVATTVEIVGRILTAVDGDGPNHTIKLAQWSNISAEQADCYRKLSVEVLNASQIVRKLFLPNAFVVDYSENFANDDGTGTFRLKARQKKDKIENVTVEGGYGF